LLIDGIVIGFLIALLRGGKFGNLANVDLKAVWLTVIAFAIQFSAIFLFPSLLAQAVILSYGILIIFCLVNRRQAGFYLMVAGMLLNIIVMLANGGRMPVEMTAAAHLSPQDVPALEAGTYGKHIAMSDQTHLNFLGDFIYLRSPYPHHTIISIGDILLSLGVILYLQKAMAVKKFLFKGSAKSEF